MIKVDAFVGNFVTDILPARSCDEHLLRLIPSEEPVMDRATACWYAVEIPDAKVFPIEQPKSFS